MPQAAFVIMLIFDVVYIKAIRRYSRDDAATIHAALFYLHAATHAV